MNVFHLRFSVILFFLSISISNISFSQSCQDCGKRNIGVYDPSVLVPRPTGDASTVAAMLPRWWQLFRVGSTIRAYMHNQDPSNGCMFFTDINIMRAEPGSWSSKDSLVFGTEWANTPPPGPINSLDYLVESSVSGTEGNYTLTASLEAAVSREVVATGTMQFTDMWNAPDAAQSLAAQYFAPIYNKIRAWEENKRDNDPDVAMGAEKITITPEKKRIEVTEEVNVNFEFKDCDDKPLKNKTLLLVEGEAEGIRLEGPKGGQFTTSSVTTDDEGKATAVFKADNKPGEGVLRAYFVYKYPSGHTGIAGGEAVIQIAQAPVEYWEYTATVTNSYNFTADTSWAGSLGGIPYNGFNGVQITSNGSLSARGLFMNEAYEPGIVQYSGAVDPIIAGFASGSYTETEFSNRGEYIMGSLVSGDTRIDVMGGPVISNYAGLSFYYDENSTDYREAGVGAACRRIGGYKGKWFDGPDWVNYDGKYDDSVANVSAGWDPDKGNGSFTKTDSGYVVHYSLTETFKQTNSYGTGNGTKTSTLDLMVRPYTYLTSVKRKDAGLLPEKTKLYQNYPNPFNPQTNIDFFIAKDGVVTVKVYDVLGKEISTLINDYKKKGFYTVKFNAGSLTSGIYFYKLYSNGYSEQKKLIVLK